MTHPLTPTQADRDAAAEFVKALYDKWGPDVEFIVRDRDAPSTRLGHRDDGTLVQAFARHAQAARLAGARAMQEAAVRYALASAHNARLPMLIERYGDEATEHAQVLLEALADNLTSLDPLSIAEKGV